MPHGHACEWCAVRLGCSAPTRVQHPIPDIRCTARKMIHPRFGILQKHCPLQMEVQARPPGFQCCLGLENETSRVLWDRPFSSCLGLKRGSLIGWRCILSPAMNRERWTIKPWKQARYREICAVHQSVHQSVYQSVQQANSRFGVNNFHPSYHLSDPLYLRV